MEYPRYVTSVPANTAVLVRELEQLKPANASAQPAPSRTQCASPMLVIRGK